MAKHFFLTAVITQNQWTSFNISSLLSVSTTLLLLLFPLSFHHPSPFLPSTISLHPALYPLPLASLLPSPTPALPLSLPTPSPLSPRTRFTWRSSQPSLSVTTRPRKTYLSLYLQPRSLHIFPQIKENGRRREIVPKR